MGGSVIGNLYGRVSYILFVGIFLIKHLIVKVVQMKERNALPFPSFFKMDSTLYTVEHS